MIRSRQSGVKLRIHLGPEKTGTSFLQCLSVANRNLLESRGIHFPAGTPHDERTMRKGRISAGNGRTLSRMVDAGQWQPIEDWFNHAIEECLKAGCNDLLISSEQLLAPLARPGTLEQFLTSWRLAGGVEVSLLLVLREPVSQLLSLYKHRAKGGSVGRIEEWVEDGYCLPKHLRELRQQVKATNVGLYVRAYSREPGGLERVFFRDWLGLEDNIHSVAAEVNPSLSLSELEVVRLLHALRPDLVPFLFDKLAALPRGKKVQGRLLEEHGRAVAENAVWHHRQEWQHWNELLPESERLSVPDGPRQVPEYPREVGFTGEQLESLAGFLAEAARFRFLLRLMWRARVRPSLGKIARALGMRK